MQGVPDSGSAAAAIEFLAVTKRYPGREAPAVRELSLSVPAGEICVLIGPSGSGKTTAMKMVNRLIDITDGDITIGGQSVRSLDLTELRRGHRLRLPADRPVPAHERGGQHRDGAAAAGVGQAAHPRARGRAARARRPRAERRQALPGPVLWRPAPAHRCCACHGRRPADHAHGRALRRRGPDRARPAAERLPAPARRGPEDRHLRHARHRRGDQDGPPDRHPQGRRAGPVRHARRDPRQPGQRVHRRLRGCRPRPQAPAAARAARHRADVGQRRVPTSCRPSTSARACATRSRSWSPGG